MWILGQYLWQLGLFTESRRPMEDGQRVRYYRLNTEDVEFIQKVLDYRHRQREDRERKRQESQDRNAAYAAKMQAQYGVEQRGRSLWQEPITRDGGAEEQRGKVVQISPLHPCTPAALPSSSPSTPPNEINGSNNWGGMDTDAEASGSWWERVKYYAQVAIERVEYGVQ